MKTVRTTKRFRRDYVRMKRSGKKIAKLETVMGLLIDGKSLPASCKDHALQGDWKHLRDCHIEGDWILLYEMSTDLEGYESITFHATDNYGNLFG